MVTIACASAPREPSSPAPTGSPIGGRIVLTEHHDGRTLVLDRSAQVELHLDDPGWAVEAEGEAILLVSVSSFDDTGDVRWEVRVLQQGRSVLRGSAPGGRTLSITIHVAGD